MVIMRKSPLVFTLMMLSAFTFNAIAQGKGSAPGQIKNTQGAQSAKAYAPGQVKNAQGAQSAKVYAPGQVKKKKGAKSAKAYAPGKQ